MDFYLHIYMYMRICNVIHFCTLTRLVRIKIILLTHLGMMTYIYILHKSNQWKWTEIKTICGENIFESAVCKLSAIC